MGAIVIVIIAITVGVLVWKIKNGNNENTNNESGTMQISKAENHYSNSDYGFSLDLPYATDKYVVQISPNTIAKITFLLPATNQKFLEYTGHALADAFSILAYPKSKIAEIKQECEQGSLKYDSRYECLLNSEQTLAENDTYSFYYLKGGVFYDAYPQAMESVEYSKSENAMRTLRANSATLNFDANARHIFVDHKYGYEMEYPNDWKAESSDSPSFYRQNLKSVFSTSGPMGDREKGTLLFGKYDIYNNVLTDSVDGNVKILKSKVKAKLKEIKIAGGRAFYNPLQTALPSNQRDIFIVGKDVIFNGNVSIFSYNADTKLDAQKLDKFADILSHFKFLQTSSIKNNDTLDDFKISNFEKWKTYSSKDINVALKYPPEFHMSTFGGNEPGVFFYYLNPDNLSLSINEPSLASFRLSLEPKKTVAQHIDEFKHVLNNMKREQIQINGISADKILYTDVMGETLYKILIQKGSDLIVVAFADNDQLNDTYNKILSTINLFK